MICVDIDSHLITERDDMSIDNQGLRIPCGRRNLPPERGTDWWCYPESFVDISAEVGTGRELRTIVDFRGVVESCADLLCETSVTGWISEEVEERCRESPGSGVAA